MSKTCMLCGRETVHRPDVGTFMLTEETFECEECDARYYYTGGKLEAVGFIEPRPDNQGGYWRRAVPIPEGTLFVIASEKIMSKNFCLACDGVRKPLPFNPNWKDSKGKLIVTTECEKCEAYYHADSDGLMVVYYDKARKGMEVPQRRVEVPNGCLLVLKAEKL